MDDSMDISSSSQNNSLSRLTLDLRGSRFVIERETLMNLPESVLLCLFPNGLVLSRGQGGGGGFGAGNGEEGEDEEDEEEEVYIVDFDPQCLSFVLSFFKKAQDDFYGTPSQPGKYRGHHGQGPSTDFNDPNNSFGTVGLGNPHQNPLLSKQAIIVLREELEYFVIPPKATSKLTGDGREGTDDSGKATTALLELKQASGQALLDRQKIFTALQRNVNKENNMAEQHLIDMLCMSGFDREDSWGFRALEPSRCCITSIALVLLKTGIRFSGEDGPLLPNEEEVEGMEGTRIDQQQLTTAQKLLLFWRKPARKCWWDGVDIVVPHTSASLDKAVEDGSSSDEVAAQQEADEAVEADVNATTAGMTMQEVELLRNRKGRKCRVWARRVWTLELSLIRIFRLMHLGSDDPSSSRQDELQPPTEEIASLSTTELYEDSLPRLPPELLLQIFTSPNLSPITSPSPLTYQTLQSLLLVCRLSHGCAKQHLYEVLVLPRKVRDFRRYYDKERNKGWKGVGLTRGLFCALEDVSRLTHTSAGWEAAFLRMLHILGPTITHLSLWNSESRALLRDAGQLQSRRKLGTLGPSWSWGQGEDFLGDLVDPNEFMIPINEDGTPTRDEEIRVSDIDTSSAAELAALKERSRQRMPNWLKAELSKPGGSTAEVAKRLRAHLLPFGDPDGTDVGDSLTQHLVREERDKRRIRGCRPTHLSLILSLPLFENQEPDLFANLMIFSRCKELDLFLPVPAHSDKVLSLVAHLDKSPLKRLKITSTHFTLVMGVPPFSAQQAKEIERRKRRAKQAYIPYDDDEQEAIDAATSTRRTEQPPKDVNLALALRAMLQDSTIHDLLRWEFGGHHADDVPQLERLFTSTALAGIDDGIAPTSAPATGERNLPPRRWGRDLCLITPNMHLHQGSYPSLDYHGSLPSSSSSIIPQQEGGEERLRIRVFQRNQGSAGKLKDRREDFVTRVLGKGEGIWTKCGL